jgi:hypothetical protein
MVTRLVADHQREQRELSEGTLQERELHFQRVFEAVPLC